MGRIIGNFKIDGYERDTAGFDLDNLRMIKIKTSDVKIMKNNVIEKVTVTFPFAAASAVNKVKVNALMSIDNKEYTSGVKYLEELDFAKIISDCTNKFQLIDEHSEIIRLKKEMIADLIIQLRQDGIILTNSLMNGIGFIFSNGLKVATIDRMMFSVTSDGGNIIKLYDFVTEMDLSQTTKPTIEFYCDSSYKTVLTDFSILTLSAENRRIVATANLVSQEPTNEVFEPLVGIKNDIIPEDYESSRLTLLDNVYTSDEVFIGVLDDM